MSVVDAIDSLFEYLKYLIGYFKEIFMDTGRGVLAFINYVFSDCIPVGLQALVYFLIILLVINAFIGHFK